MTPTRRTRLPGLGWAKREDEAHPVYGGNKVRKLAAILQEARSQGATRLVTAGTAGSHHVAATAVHGTAAGLEVHAILGPQCDSGDARAHLALTAATCASVTPVSRPRDLATLLRRTARNLSALQVPIGGSSPEGMAGSIDLGVELAGDLAADAAQEVVVPFGSGGTAVGIALGLAIEGRETPVRAVQVSPRVFSRTRRLRRLAEGGVRVWAPSRRRPVPSAVVDQALQQIRLVVLPHDPGYSRPCPEARAAVQAGAALGLPLEETYSGRAFAHLLRHPPEGGAAFVVTGTATVPHAPPPPSHLLVLLRGSR